MTWKERRERRARLRMNLTDHLGLDANSELPESHDLRFARALIYTLVVTLTLSLIWAARTDVSEIATGKGVIKTEIRIERVEHATGGQVRKIDVEPGARVEEGTRLLAFETETLKREIAKQRSALAALETERARIDFVLEGRLPDDIADASHAETPEALLFWTEQRYLEAQLDVIASDRASIEAALASLLSRKANLAEEFVLLSDGLERSREGLEKGWLSKREVDRQVRDALQEERSLLSLDAEIAAQRAALDGTRLKTVELIAARRREAALRIADLESGMASARLSIAELEALVRRADVYATVSGTVMSLGASHASEVIGAGETIAEIVPENSDVRAEIEMPARSIGGIKVGMGARIKVETFDFTRFGELDGEVVEISPTSFENPQGETVYSIIVRFDGAGVPALDGKPIRPGMTVTADILTESKAVLTYLLKPLRLLRDRAFTEA